MKLVPFKRKDDFFPAFSLFDDFMNTYFNDDIRSDSKLMAMDILENDNEYIIKSDLPGLKKDDVKISLNDGELLIETKFDKKEEKKDKNYIRQERYSGHYQRILKLSDNCNVDKIDAKMEDGVLTITIPKMEPKPKKEIKIK